MRFWGRAFCAPYFETPSYANHVVFNSVFPIRDFNDTASLEFVGYALEQPKYDVQECLQRGMTYAAPFKVTIRLVAWDDAEGSQTIRDVKEQEVYFGEIPIMTENGTFVINGTERVIVSQLHRSPGIFYDTSISTTASAAGKDAAGSGMASARGLKDSKRRDIDVILYNSTFKMCPLTLTSLKSLVFPNKILSISVVCSIILPLSPIGK